MADPVGFALNIAIQAAISLAIAALTPKKRIEGPRLDDTSISSSAYGKAIPIGYGTDIVAGNIMWGKDIEEEKKTYDIGKGNPFSLGTRTEYKYYVTCAVGISARKVQALLAIYADGKLIYSAENLADDPADPGHPLFLPEILPGANVTDEEDETATKIRRDVDFTFYDGDDLQPPDPIIQADVGEAVCPAFRGTSYVVFNRLPLKDFGNRIPQFRFVVAWAPPNNLERRYDLIGSDEDQIYDINIAPYFWDQSRGMCFSYREISGAAGFFECADSETGEVIWTRPYNRDLLGDLRLFCGGVGPYALWHSSNGEQRPIYVLEKATGEIVTKTGDVTAIQTGNYSGAASFVSTGGTYLNASGHLDVVEVRNFFKVQHYAIGGAGGDHGTWFIARLPSLSRTAYGNGFDPTMLGENDPESAAFFNELWDMDNPADTGVLLDLVGGAFERGFVGGVQGRQFNNYTEYYCLLRVYTGTETGVRGSSAHADMHYRVDLLHVDIEGTLADVPVEARKGGDVPAEDFAMQAGRSGAPALWYDEDLEYLILFRGSLMVCYDAANSMQEVWRLEGIDVPDIIADGQNRRIQGNRILLRRPSGGAVFWEIDVTDGSVVETYTIPGSSFTVGDGLNDTIVPTFYDNRFKRGLAYNGNLGWEYFPPVYDRASETLDTVVEDIVTRGKLSASDIDVTGIAHLSTRGYVIAREGTYRSALEPIATAYNITGVEKDGKLVFTPRTGEADFTIDEDELVQRGANTAFEEVRGDETKAPRSVTVSYRSANLLDETGTQQARRDSDSIRTTNSKGDTTLELPFVLTDQEAAEVAERLLYESRLNLESFSFSLPPKYLSALPSDVINIQIEGRTESIRIERVAVGANFDLEVEGVVTDGELYTARIVAAPLYGSPNYNPRRVGTLSAEFVIGFILDMPLLQTVDGLDRDAGATMYFVAAQGMSDRDRRFPGAGVQTDVNNSGFVNRAVALNPVPWGIVRTQVPDIPSPGYFSIQEATIRVRMGYGAASLSSVTEANLIGNNSNTAVLYRPDSGQVEIIGFRDVEEVEVDGQTLYDLTGLLRGKRGTDAMATGYPSVAENGLSDELVYLFLLDRSAVERFIEPNSLNDATITYRVIPNTLGEPELVSRELTYNHRALMPYAPVHPRLYADDPSTGNWTLTWQRRTRQDNGAFTPQSVSVPLAEDSESYEVDILDGSGGSVLRTLASSTRSVVYTLDQVEEDFGSGGLPEPLYARIYQISAQVGRGFSHEWALVEETQ